ncbi:MAG: SUMF1/EgtB/PvdO family nonheme iron enzyme [Coleofasciculaceae cyanobacterium]
MLRGGSWNNNPENCRSAYRNNNNPGDRHNNNIGFRVVCAAACALLCQNWWMGDSSGVPKKSPDLFL